MPIVVDIMNRVTIEECLVAAVRMIHNADNYGHLTSTSEVDNNGYLTGEYTVYQPLERKKTKFPHVIFILI
ncbi:hypothetical protein C0J52_15464 [Blattella germanica]|nr:hypothetical protein C0J52_15464 [Blattella germanica]